jgi:hypothetical protein
MKSFSTLILTALVFTSPVASFATSFSLSGEFSGTAIDVTGSSHAYHFSGEFSAEFANSAVPNSGLYQLFVAPQLVSFTDPTIGATTLDTTNVGIQLGYQDGVLVAMAFGGIINQPSGIASGTDDFMLYSYPLGVSTLLFYSTSASSSEFAIDFGPSFRYSLTEVSTVPDGTPGLDGLLGCVSLLIYVHRRIKPSEGVMS